MAINESENRPTIPRSIRHKQILDAAEAQPDASMEAIADEIPSATAELVERVLEEYGDPAADQSDSSSDGDDWSGTQEHIVPDLDDLSTSQRDVLHAIAEHPSATQRELADRLDVSGSTVSNRANSIPGFSWDDRQSFAGAVFDIDEPTAAVKSSHMVANKTEYEATVDQLAERVIDIEQQVTELGNTDKSGSAFGDSDLVHKVAHACLSSDAITEEEELQILRWLLE